MSARAEVIFASAKDPDVHLYYRASTKGFITVVIGGDDPGKCFVITAYFTKAIEKGPILWRT